MILYNTSDVLYLDWLKNLGKGCSYDMLFAKLYSIPYESFIPHDENRISDVLELREMFKKEVLCDSYWQLDRHVISLLEIIISLAVRANDIMRDDTDDIAGWLWVFLENVDLDDYSDENWTSESEAEVEEIAHNIIFRDYAEDGRGGLFPLRNNTDDQRKVEMWYQLNAYLDEKF